MPGDLTKWFRHVIVPQGEELELDVDEPSIPGTGPILKAPISLAGGGVIYFDDPDEARLSHLKNTLELMGVYLKAKSYAVFFGATLEPKEDCYLHQVRIVTHNALRYTFKAEPEADALPDQPMSIGAYIDAFIAEQQGKWNDDRRYSRSLDGLLGGDADSAREVLGFGFAVENPSMGIYRLWSRPWLVTK